MPKHSLAEIVRLCLGATGEAAPSEGLETLELTKEEAALILRKRRHAIRRRKQADTK